MSTLSYTHQLSRVQHDVSGTISTLLVYCSTCIDQATRSQVEHFFWIATSHTFSKLFHIFFCIFQCPWIFSLADLCFMLNFCHGLPPVQGIASHNMGLSPSISLTTLSPVSFFTKSSFTLILTCLHILDTQRIWYPYCCLLRSKPRHLSGCDSN